ncbi:hypothetical protein [Ammoniphilus resinae]|uniref:Uncharacterized protein n=1 Tax=Ammoniphilus resinae TaxID=861532 RepID=A0ABS4GXQ8_9BACL|nr:hypothetical protein [Ammoniphilus resinae]MBP1935055.1 hypothetical protein [Ammoniphilus resinae]
MQKPSKPSIRNPYTGKEMTKNTYSGKELFWKEQDREVEQQLPADRGDYYDLWEDDRL